MTGRRIALALLAGVALLLPACSGDAPDATGTASSAPATSARATGAPAAIPPDIADRLLPPVAAYVNAVNSKNLDALVNAFAPTGEVVDAAAAHFAATL